MKRVLHVKAPVPSFFRLGGKRHGAPEAPGCSAAVISSDTHRELIGKAVFFANEGERVAGKAIRAEGDKLVVQLAIPSREGILLITDTELTVKATDLEVTKALMQQKRMKAFEAGAAIELSPDRKFIPVYDTEDGLAPKIGTAPIEDYLNVEIEGFASTFVETTKRDRGGDYILPGAFDRTLAEFMKNPVILTDHRNSVEMLAGSWTKVGQNARGLAVQGRISNAPGVRDTRFKLVEGHLKGLSIGGIFFYTEDNYGIDEVTLFEISLTPVPMNPDALAFTRSLGVADCRKAFAKFWRGHSTLRPE